MSTTILAGGYNFRMHFDPADGSPRIVFPFARSVTTASTTDGVILALDTFLEVASPSASLVGTKGAYSVTLEQSGRTDVHEGDGEVLAMTSRRDIEDATLTLYVFGPDSAAAKAISDAIVAAWMARTMLPPIADREMELVLQKRDRELAEIS